MDEGDPAGNIDKTWTGRAADAGAQRAVPIGLYAEDDCVEPLRKRAINAERADISFHADDPLRTELPVVSRLHAAGEPVVRDVGQAGVAG